MLFRSRLSSRLLTSALLCLGLSFTACSKFQDATKDLQPGKAFMDSQIPPGLSPQYFPPEGFVWGAYRHKSLPEARYGVASPPINPRAQVLILADADYPAESYFELTRQLLSAGYGVWLFEPPGQGGAGHYLLQTDAVFAPNDHDAEASAVGFINDIIHPTADKPLFIIGTGYSAINALSLSTEMKADGVRGFVAYDPYTGGAIPKGTAWHSDDKPASYWGGVAQTWQASNPDLRLRIKSETWRSQMTKAYTDLNGLHLPVISLQSHGASVLVIAPKAGSTTGANGASSLCAHLPHCTLQPGDGPQALGQDLTTYIKGELPAVQ